VGEEETGFKVTDRRINLDEPAHAAPSNEGPGQRQSSSHAESRSTDFSGFLISLGTSALIHMGQETHPALGKVEVNLDEAKELIDLLALLEEKTKGNLTEDEKELLTKLLFTLRMKFVETSAQKRPTSP